MSRRDPRLFLAGILEAIEKVERYTRGLAREELWNDDLVAGAVVRNPEIVGEAARHVPEGLRAAHPEIDRRRVVGLGNVVGHERFAVDLDVVHGHLPQLKRAARAMLEAGPQSRPLRLRRASGR
ncbi:protein of unknown function DUF86 [Oceanithermus profundus DSM 14977]|uniref:DUF86 domain-containing protein n=1 Tax=Oceanithermus profundus (strain DSM 14977 / NBRC 100410 / VKM B-2274 / 506) TaxID=670487 RepID=E4U6C6_OCEP5|nr:HepT-like ribonuclease domain-containing protein [Oceanithermus profundus]ADR35546.1 protein of unknown function DUF86 [Oceanithermus profundus DSM 14977]